MNKPRIPDAIPYTPLSVNRVTLFCHGESYSITFADHQRGQALRTLGAWAENPDLDFSWSDAWEMGEMIHSQAEID